MVKVMVQGMEQEEDAVSEEAGGSGEVGSNVLVFLSENCEINLVKG